MAFSCGDESLSKALYVSSKGRDFDEDISCQIAPLHPFV